MAELERSALISDEAYQAPLVMSDRFQTLIGTLVEVRKAAAGASSALAGGGSNGKQKQAVDELTRAQEKLNKANSDTAKELAKLQVQTQAQTKANRDDAKSALGLTGAYDKLSKELNDARKAYKDMASSGRATSKELQAQANHVNALDKRIKKIDASVGQFQRNVGNYPKVFQGAIKAFNGLKAALGAVGIALGIVEAIRFGKEFLTDSKEVADRARGVEYAFRQLGETGQEAFDKIKASTRGTLSDLSIKTSINEFRQFNLDLDRSATLFEFLSVAAIQTGKSVDDLKQSLVEGLSKESKLRIDNLGISAAELNEELKKTPSFIDAVANIAQRKIDAAGNILDSAASSQEKWNSELENFKQFVGEGAIFQSITNGVLDTAAAFLKWARTSETLVNYLKALFVNLRVVIRLGQIARDAFDSISGGSNILAESFSWLLGVTKSIIKFFAEFPDYLTGFIYAWVETFSVIRDVASDSLQFVKDLIIATFDPTQTIASVIGRVVKTVEDYGARIGKAYTDGFNKYRKTINGEEAVPGITPGKRTAPAEEGKDTTKKDLADRQKDIDAATKYAYDALKKRRDAAKQIAEEITGFEKKRADDIKNIIDAELKEKGDKYNQDALAFAAAEEYKTKKLQEEQAKREAIIDFTAQAIDLIGNSIFENDQARIDAQSEKLEVERERQLDAAGEDARKKEQINRAFDRKQAQLRKQQARAEKEQTIYNIVLATAYNVVKFFGNPLMQALAAALGALQIGVAAAAKIPEFFMGTSSSPDTFTAGERGRELMIPKEGKPFVSPAKKTLYTGMEGTMIIPSRDTEEILGTLNDVRLPYDTDNLQVVEHGNGWVLLEAQLAQNNLLMKKLADKPTPSWSFDRFGVHEFWNEGASRTEKINKRFKTW